eukprot:COSAG01_NODE_954_length_12493_cov_8.138454_5_plen_281_part_00
MAPGAAAVVTGQPRVAAVERHQDGWLRCRACRGMDDTGDDETPRYSGGSQCDEKANAFYWFNEHTGESRWEPPPTLTRLHMMAVGHPPPAVEHDHHRAGASQAWNSARKSSARTAGVGGCGLYTARTPAPPPRHRRAVITAKADPRHQRQRRGMRSAGEPWVAHHVPTSPRGSSAGTPRRRPHSATRAFGACVPAPQLSTLSTGHSAATPGLDARIYATVSSPRHCTLTTRVTATGPGARLSTPLRVGNSILVRESRTGRSVRACQFPVSVSSLSRLMSL